MSAVSHPPHARDQLTVRACSPSDHAAMAELMTSTMLLGAPVTVAGLEPYVWACLDPYLQRPGAESVVAVDAAGAVVGYALIGLDSVAVDRRARRALVPLVRTVASQWIRGRLPRDAARFYRLRMRDLLGLARGARHRAGEPHGHLNVAAGLRSGSVALMLRDHIDECVARAGHTRWWGEVNAEEGRRATALTRLGFEVIGRAPNHTLSRFTGQRVERLTLCRRLDELTHRGPQSG